VIGEDPERIALRREDRPETRLDFRRFVHTSGAVYAFAPSLTALRQIANGTIGQQPAPGGLHPGGKAFITRRGNSSWRLRATPGLGGRIVGQLSPGTEMTLIEGPRPVDGLDWWRIQTKDNRQGWVASGGLVDKPD
jgi:hypothetical protein